MPMAHYTDLALLFEHPDSGYGAVVARAISLHASSHARVTSQLEQFQRLLPLCDLVALRELHTRTFDVQPITSLDIGYTLFGEDYKRGALLANLSGEHARAGNDCGLELADHLSNVLRLLPKLEDVALREELVRVLLGPALQEMIREFDGPRLSKKEVLYKKHHKTIIAVADGELRTAYRLPLEALYEALREDFGLMPSLPISGESKFFGSVGTEMGIENSVGCAANPRGT